MRVLFLFFYAISFLFSQDFVIDFFLSPKISPYVHEWQRNPENLKLKILYTGSSSKIVRLYAEIIHSSAGLIFSGYSREIVFNPGETKNINSTNVLDWSTVIYHSDFGRIIGRTGRLPEGEYEICIEVKELSDLTLSRACQTFRIVYPSPPNLIYPVNIEVPDRFPFFNWTSVSVPWDIRISYKLRIWKAYKNPLTGKIDVERSIRFPPYFEQEINMNSFSYPVSAPPLEKSESYIWQVQVFDNLGNPLGENDGKSEFAIFEYNPLPRIIKIKRFVIEVENYASGSNINNLSGNGRSFFVSQTGEKVYFELNFNNLKGIIRGDTIRITRGNINKLFPSPLKVRQSDYEFYISSINLSPESTEASFNLEIPYLYDTLNFKPLKIQNINAEIDPHLNTYFVLGREKISPFTFGDYGIYFVIEDSVIFDLSLLYPTVEFDVGAGRRVSMPDLSKSVRFKRGITIRRRNMRISNAGYLYGNYSFKNSELRGRFFKAELELKDTFSFRTILPYGFVFLISKAEIFIDSSIVKGGYIKGKVKLPEGKNGLSLFYSDLPPTLRFDSLNFDRNLSLTGNININIKFTWGNFGIHKSGVGKIIIKGKDYYFTEPLIDTLPFYEKYDTLQGFSFNFDDNDTIYILTKEEPERNIIKIYSNNFSLKGYFLVSVGGVTGYVRIKHFKVAEIFKKRLKGIYTEFYKSKDENAFTLKVRAVRDSYGFYISFVGNSLYDANLNGKTDSVPSPSRIDIPFRKMNLTSTASFIGGRIIFSEPRRLEKWGVDVRSENGVLSIRDGMAVFTYAYMEEKRHFSKPFVILWGEIFADGRLGEFYFKKDISQKFDGYPITISDASLGKPTDTTRFNGGALIVKGLIHFNLFGIPDTEVTIYDIKFNNVSPPFNGRYVLILPDSFRLMASWGRRYIVFDINKVRYNEDEQNGFKGRGISEVSFFLDSPVFTVFRSDSLNTLLCLRDSNSHVVSFGIGGIPMFKLFDVWGCVFISGDTLRELTIGGYLADYTQTEEFFLYPVRGSALRTKVRFVISPTKVKTLVQGEFYLSITETVRIIGYLYTLYKRNEPYLEGTVEAEFRANTSELGVLSFGKIYGKVDFHLSEEKFYVMGEVSITTVLNIAGALFGGGIHARGNFFLGYNVPKDDIWVFNASYGRFRFRKELVIDRNVTGFFASTGVDLGVDLFIVSGRFQMFIAGGLFITSVGPNAEPNAVGQCGVYIRGEVLRGLLSAALFADLGLQKVGMVPTGFGGSVGLEVCAAWVLCETLVLDFSITLNETEGGGYGYDVKIEAH